MIVIYPWVPEKTLGADCHTASPADCQCNSDMNMGCEDECTAEPCSCMFHVRQVHMLMHVYICMLYSSYCRAPQNLQPLNLTCGASYNTVAPTSCPKTCAAALSSSHCIIALQNQPIRLLLRVSPLLMPRTCLHCV